MSIETKSLTESYRLAISLLTMLQTMWLLWKSCRHCLSSMTSCSIMPTIASCVSPILSTSALPTLSQQVLGSTRNTWIVMVWTVTMTMMMTTSIPPLLIKQGLNLIWCSSQCSCQSIRHGLGVWGAILSSLLQILSTTYVHQMPESNPLPRSSNSVPRMILFSVVHHHYSLSNMSWLNRIWFISCFNISVFFEWWASMSLEIIVLILDIKAVDMYFASELSIGNMRLTTTDWELLESIEGVLEMCLLNTLLCITLTQLWLQS